MSLLLKRLNYKFSDATVRSVVSFFDNVGLPLPVEYEDDEKIAEGECIKTSDQGFLLFVNPTAVTIRLTRKDMAHYMDIEETLKPLGTRHTDDARIDINPGIEAPARARDVLDLHNRMQTRGLRLWDMKPQNLGHIPAAATGGIQTGALIIDPEAVQALSNGLTAKQKATYRKWWLRNMSVSMAQFRPSLPADQNVYASLRDAFKAAWPQDHENADPAKMKDFWKECASFKARAYMVCGWLNNPDVVRNNYKNARDGSRNYEERLKGMSCPF